MPTDVPLDWVNYDPDITECEQLLLCDAQTSGGLLAALPGDRGRGGRARPSLASERSSAAVIGSIERRRARPDSCRRAPTFRIA